jgi:hypothetical protein
MGKESGRFAWNSKIESNKLFIKLTKAKKIIFILIFLNKKKIKIFFFFEFLIFFLQI